MSKILIFCLPDPARSVIVPGNTDTAFVDRNAKRLLAKKIAVAESTDNDGVAVWVFSFANQDFARFVLTTQRAHDLRAFLKNLSRKEIYCRQV